MNAWIKISMALLIGMLVVGCAGTGGSLRAQQPESPFPISAGPQD
jgi:hypothetical protein